MSIMENAPAHFFCETIPDNGDICELSPEESRHAARALRVTEGDEIALLDGKGTRAYAEVSQIAGKNKREHLVCEVIHRSCFEPPRAKVNLYVALPRSNRAASIFRQATELGTWKITPIKCSRSVAKPDSARVKTRWHNEAKAAMKQSGNVFLPDINRPLTFEEALRNSEGSGIVGDEESGSETLRLEGESTGWIEVWVGPEGGFSKSEKESMFRLGLHGVRVSEWTLRVDTAVTALLGWLKGKVNPDDTCAQSRG